MSFGRRTAAAAPPLWTCPKCGAKLVGRNMWHSCGRATVAEWTALTSPRFARVQEVVPGWWVHTLRVTDPAQLDELLQGWLRESYRVMGMQERLGRSGPGT